MAASPGTPLVNVPPVVPMTFFALIVLAGFAFYVMKPEERERFLSAAFALLGQAGNVAGRAVLGRGPDRPRNWAEWPLLVPALVLFNAAVFVAMLFGSGAIGDPETLVAWGGNFGPRTTNGEWGRLVQAMFVHAGFFHLVITMIGLLQAGIILERRVGYLALSVVYFMAGFCASLVSVLLHPLSVSVGASAAVLGLYGFLGATAIRKTNDQPREPLSLERVKSFAPAAGLFVLYNLAWGGLQFGANLAGFATGCAYGLLLSGRISEGRPAPRRVAGALAGTFLGAAAIAIPLYGITDVRPEIARIVSIEEGSSAKYEAAVQRFRKGVITARQLADVIERTIVPEFESAQARLKTVRKVPREHQALLASAEKFLQLRDESWRLRAEALHERNMSALRRADQAEVTSLAALEQIKPAVGQ